MNILFDISILGHGHVNPVSRTGIFRVIENLAEQLIIHPDCDLTFMSNWDRDSVQYSVDYLRTNKSLSSTPFSKPPLFDLRETVRVKKEALINRLVVDTSLSPVKKISLKVQIRRLRAYEQLCKLYNDHLIHSRDINRADIYHSPFIPLPDQKFRKGFKSAFLTCYDLIPILFPHYFEGEIIGLVNDAINSIDLETWVLCISEATRNDLLNHLGNKVNPQRVIVTELAASDTFYQSTDKERNGQIRKKHQIPDVPYVLSLCTFEPRKNIDQVIKAFAKLTAQENIKDLHLVLVGTKGWKFDKIYTEIAQSEELRKRIIITGFVADEDLAAIYSDALFFVYPSLYEGFGLPPLEAMKCGVPVITSNTSSLPEVIGDAGIMVSPTDLDALCQAMLSVYNSPALRQQMAEKSRLQASRFSWERCAQQTVDAYKRSLQQ